MGATIEIRVFDRNRLLAAEEFSGPVELGRQSGAQETLYVRSDLTGRSRLAIAHYAENTVSRRHLLIEPLDGRRARVTNASALLPLRLPDGGELKPGMSRDLAIPASFDIGERVVRVAAAADDDMSLQSLAGSVAPGRPAAPAMMPVGSLAGGDDSAEGESLVRWIQTLVEVFQSAVGGPDLFRTAALAMVDLVGLDSGRVLTHDRDKGRWDVEEAGVGRLDDEWAPSRKVLARILSDKRTFWQEPGGEVGAGSGSLIRVNTVVAAPILDRRGEVIGTLYGERRMGGKTAGLPKIRKLDAMLVELLASGVATGLARIEQEKAAMAAKVQFEQFFTPELADELAARPDLLKGQEVEVSMLFCDLRGFSRISERVGPATTVRWIGDVMGVLSDCVLDHRGVLMDYIGDELIAMWGAPKREPEHARLACGAALDMLAKLPEINARWESTLGEPVELGIGINTGIAQVGNTGTHRKFKYGALGGTVNLASRVQGATKYMKTRLLITGSTRAQLDDGFSCRRLCTVAVVNIARPIELYELAPPGQPGWGDLRREYESALARFEAQDFGGASQILGNILPSNRADGPTLVLLGRVVSCLLEEPTGFDPVWKLPGK